MRVDAFILSCLLLLCGIAWAVDTPVLEYRTGSDLMQIRPTAYTAGIEGSSRSAAAAYTPITKTVTSTSMITPIIPVGSAGLRTWCNDTTRDVLLCNGGKILYTATFDGTTFTKTEVFNLAVNNAANPDYAYAASNSALTIQGVFCKDGIWLLSIGRYAIPSAGTNTGRMYRSTDAGATWTQVLSTDYGWLHAIGEADGFLTVGSYINALNTHWTKYNNNVWVSYDVGATWDKVLGDLDFTVPSDNTTRHNHSIIGGDGDEFMHICGDAKSCSIRYVSRPDDWEVGDGTGPNPAWTDEQNSAGDWDVVELNIDFQGNGGIYKDGKFYVTCSGGGFTSSTPGRIIWFDKNDNWKTGQAFFPPDDVTALNGYGGTGIHSGPYKYNSDIGAWCRGINEYNGTYYTVVYKYSTDTTDWAKSTGLYASRDLENWTAVYRDPSIFGTSRPGGIWNGTHFIFQHETYPGSVVTFHTAFVPIPEVVSIDAQMVSLGYTNYAGPTDIDNVTFANDIGSWAYSTHDTRRTLSLATGEGLYGSNALSIDQLSGASSHASYSPPGYNSTIIDGAGGTVKDHMGIGTFYSLSAFMRLADDVEACWTCTSRIYGTGYDAQNNRYLLSHSWQRVIGTGYVTGDPPVSTVLNFLMDSPQVSDFTTRGYASDAAGLAASEEFLDGATLFLHNDRWLSHSLPVSIPGTSPYTSSDDFIVVPITTVSKAWTITFEWYPLEGVSNFPHVAGVSDPLPIGSVIGTGGTYINLQWDREHAKFELVDNDSDAVELTATSVSHRWLHWDAVKFALTSDGTDTELYMFMPENLSQNSALVETVTCTAVNVDAPVLLKLGTNYAEDDVACGAFTNVRYWDSELSAGDVEEVFNTPRKMITTPRTWVSTSGDLTGDCYVGLADLAVMSSQWMTGPEIPVDMVAVGAGWFAYQNAGPEDYVFVDDFGIDKYEVTVTAYCEFLNDGDPDDNHWDSGQEIVRTGDPGDYSYEVQAGRENYPVCYVSFYDAEAYAAWKSAITGLIYRLPTEQEWEKAAGWDPLLQKLWTYGFHRDSIDITWCNYDNAYSGPLPVGSFDGTDGKNDAKSYYGCYDMSGNVYQWTSSVYSGTNRVARGGYWNNLADYCRVAHRGSPIPSYRGESMGFRLLLDL